MMCLSAQETLIDAKEKLARSACRYGAHTTQYTACEEVSISYSRFRFAGASLRRQWRPLKASRDSFSYRSGALLFARTVFASSGR